MGASRFDRTTAALTGVTGNMGMEALRELLALPDVKLRLLVLPGDRRLSEVKSLCKNYGERVEYVFGGLSEREACEKLVSGADYVVNMASVIPPLSDRRPDLAVECNERGVECLCTAIETQKRQPRLIHISTVALYGHRTASHPWGRVGDPLIPSPFDAYALTKMRGERRVLESDIEKWVVLRQTAMLHKRLLRGNLSDGLLFHTAFNAPLEWVTAENSGRLIANILREDVERGGELEERFWNRVFNIGGGAENRATGYDVLKDGFSLIGGGPRDFFEPNFNALRNFHGVWFYDGDALQNLFHYQTQTTADYWAEVKRRQPSLSLGRAVPKSLIKKLVVQRLCRDPNSPRYWRSHNDGARVTAYFGSENVYDDLKDWESLHLLSEDKTGKLQGLLDPKNANLVDLGFDPTEEVGHRELALLAEKRGGRLLSKTGGLRDRLDWEDASGRRFQMRGYTVLAGHWENPGYREFFWDFDRLAKRDALIAQVWYDSHGEDEGYTYYFDDHFKAGYRETE